MRREKFRRLEKCGKYPLSTHWRRNINALINSTRVQGPRQVSEPNRMIEAPLKILVSNISSASAKLSTVLMAPAPQYMFSLMFCADVVPMTDMRPC